MLCLLLWPRFVATGSLFAFPVAVNDVALVYCILLLFLPMKR